jgi:hypothetical protein
MLPIYASIDPRKKARKTRANVHRLLLAGLLLLLAPASRAESISIPVLVPLTGFLSLEGQSQRNGALLAIHHPPAGIEASPEVADTGVSPEVAVNALEKALAGKPIAIIASMLGTQMLAMMPLAAEAKVPLVTISGTAKITEMGNPWVFRFFPGDEIVKIAQARYAVEVLGRKRPAIIYQTTAYGQSGRTHLDATFRKLGAAPVFEEGIGVDVKDLLPVLSKAKAAGADVLALQLHAPSTALLIRQVASMGLGLPIVAGSAIHQPATRRLRPRAIRRHDDGAPRHRRRRAHTRGPAQRARHDALRWPRHDLQVRRARQHGPFRRDPLLRRHYPRAEDRQALRQHRRGATRNPLPSGERVG